MERIFGQYREQCGKKKLLLNYEYMSMNGKIIQRLNCWNITE